jgi:hypothetical protein
MAAGQPERVGSDDRGGQQLIDRAAASLAVCDSLQVQMGQKVSLFGQQAVGAGVYLHQRTEHGVALRFELRLRFGETRTSLLQVSDGQTLWERRDLADAASLGRVDLRRLRSELSAPTNGMPQPMTPDTLAVGGLPCLIAGLAENFAFDPPQPGQVDKTDVWILRGQWQPDVLAKLFPDRQAQILAGQSFDPSALPDQMPTSVLVWLRQSDLFPVRVDYRRLTGADHTDDRSLLRMDLYDIRRNASLDRRLFTYQPGEQEVADLTDQFLDRFRPSIAGEDQPPTATQ